MSRAKRLLGVTLALGLVSAGCASIGVYPRETFTEMHYQQSYRSQESPRLQVVPNAVPITGRAVEPASFQEAGALANPVLWDSASQERARVLFSVNCAVCHGADGRGDSYLATKFQEAKVSPPVDFTGPRIKARTPGQVYWFVSNGLGNMPSFGRLLTSEERWTLVHYVRTIAGLE